VIRSFYGERRALDAPKLLEDLLAEPRKPTNWLIEPLIPTKGIVLLYGKSSIGKSPLTWKLSQVVSEGGDFFGFPVRQTGRVLYIDVDTPKEAVIPRLELLIPKPKQVYWAFDNPIDIVSPSIKLLEAFKRMAGEIDPTLVVWNTLRKLHFLDDKDSAAPSRVYAAMMRYFPDATHFVSHHDKKSTITKDTKTDPDEAFSGSQAWLNDAQVGFHLVSTDKRKRKMKLVHTKSQVSEMIDDIDLQLSQDGTTWLKTQSPAIVEAFLKLDPEMPMKERVAALAEEFNQGKSTIRRKLSEAGIIGWDLPKPLAENAQ
jgi:hypothetical protein